MSPAERRPADESAPWCDVNGERVSLAGWTGYRLIDFLREAAGLTGTKEGCGEGECGACTVLIGGEPACSCLVLTDTVQERDVTTVEGLPAGFLDAFTASVESEGGVQCGFCTPGFTVMSAWVVAKRPEVPLGKLLEGNLCRCTGYAQLQRVMENLLDAGTEVPPPCQIS